MTDEQEPCFMHYWDAIDAALMQHFGIDSCDAGIEPDTIAGAEESGWSPEEFALWYGEKYDLTPLSDFSF